MLIRQSRARANALAIIVLAATPGLLLAGNKAPSGTNKSLNVVEDTSVMVTTTDFGFKDTNDSPPDAFTNVVIGALPAATRGTLKVNGVNATVNQVVSAAATLNGWALLPGSQGFLLEESFACSSDGRRIIMNIAQADNTREMRTSADGGVTWQTLFTSYNNYALACSPDGLKITAAHSAGKLMTSTDGGATWTTRVDDGTSSFYDVAMSDNGQVILACDHGGRLHRSMDGGATWTLHESARDWESVDCSANGAVMLACPYGAQLYVSTDSGATWTARESTRNWTSAAISADGTKMMAGQAGGVMYQSSDSGSTWVAGTLGGYASTVSMSDSGMERMVYDSAQVQLSTDGGVTWVRTATNVPYGGFGLPAIISPDGTRHFVFCSSSVEAQSGVYVSYPPITFHPAAHNTVNAAFDFLVEDSGSANRRDLSSNTITFVMQAVNDAPVVATPIPDQTATEGTAFTYAFPQTTFTDPDGAAPTYTAQLLGGAALPAWLKFTASSRTFSGTPAAAHVGRLTIQVRAQDAATPPLSVTDEFHLTITSTDQPPQGTTKTVLVAANQATVLKPEDFGFSDPLDAPFSHAFNRVKITAPLPAAGVLHLDGEPVAAGDSVPMRRDIAGVNWEEKNMVYAYAGIVSSQNGMRVVSVNSNYDPQLSTDGGESWTYPNYNETINWRDLAGSGDLTHLVAAVINGRLRVSNDFGATWNERGITEFWKTVACSANGSLMVAAYESYNGTTYVQTSGIQTSTDFGVTWVARSGFDPLVFTGMDCSADGSRIYASSSGRQLPDLDYVDGQIITSTDGGASWQVVGDARKWVDIACSDDGLVIIAAEQNGQLHVSTDAGASWTARHIDRAWTRVACSADGRRMFAGDFANGQIHRSDDYGVTWSPEGPQKNWQYLACSADGSRLYAQNYGYLQISQGAAAPELTFTPVTGATGNNYAKINFQVEDTGRTGQNLDLSANVLTVNIAPINNPPTLVNNQRDVLVYEDSPLLLQLAANQFAEPNSGQTLTLGARQFNGNPLPTWLTFNAATRTFTGSPRDAEVGTVNVIVTATDNGVPAMSVTDEFRIDVLNVDYPPQGQDKTLTFTEGPSLSLDGIEITEADFGFSDVADATPHSFTRVKITELPTRGYLSDYWTGTVNVGDYITIPGLFRLIFYPMDGTSGVPYGRIGFQVEDSGMGANLDPSPNYLTFEITPTMAEIDVRQGGNVLEDGVSTVDFGTRTLGSGTGIAKEFTISNPAPGGLDISSVAIDGPHADDFIIQFQPMTPVPGMGGGQSLLQIVFNPTMPGARQATLHIRTDDANEPDFDVALTGTAVGQAMLMVTDEQGQTLNLANGLNFGNVAEGQPFSRDVIISNNGTAPLEVSGVFAFSPDFQVRGMSFPVTLAPGARLPVPLFINSGTQGAPFAEIHVNTSAGNVQFNASGTVVADDPPYISVSLPNGNFLTNNGSPVDFGFASVGVQQTLGGFISNVGAQVLKGFAVSISGPHAKDFLVELDTSGELSGSMSMPFTVHFIPSATGQRNAVVNITSNAASPKTFIIPVTGYAAAPEIVVEQPANTVLADGKGAVDFGTAATGAFMERTFTIKNTGDSELTLLPPQILIDGAHAADFSLVQPPADSVFPGSSTTFIVRYSPTTSGSRSADLHVLSTDGDESSYDIRLTGKATGPEISVEAGPKLAVIDNVTLTDLGPVLTGRTTTRTFTVKNIGTAPLQITGASILSPEPAYSLPAAAPSTLAANATRTFTVTFAPTDVQTYTETLVIFSDDADEGFFEVLLTGAGVATLSPVFTSPPQPRIVALGQTASFTSSYTPATGVSTQWSRGTGTSFSTISGATTATLNLPAVKLSDAASLYRLRVTNNTSKAFTDSQPVSLTVVDTAGGRANKAEGGSVAFTVNAATVGNLSYYWRKNGADLPADSRITGGNTRTLSIADLEAGDAATYTCDVSGAGGTLTSGAYVLTTFTAAPEIDGDPVVLPPGIISGAYSQFIPLTPTSGTPTTWTATGLPKGFAFDASTGRVFGRPTSASGAAPFSFTVKAENSLGQSTRTCTLVVNPFPTSLVGSYLAILGRGPATSDLGGRVDLTISSAGVVSGSLTLGAAKAVPLPSGNIDPRVGSTEAAYLATVPRKGLPSVSLDLGFDTATSRIFRGAISTPGSAVSPAVGWKNVWSAANQSTIQDGLYNMALQVSELIPGNPELPQGYGFASFSIGTKGEPVKITGKTPDGDSFTSSAFLGPDGELAVFAYLPSGGSLVGLTRVLPGTAPDYLDNGLGLGSLTWNRPASTSPKAVLYKAGFSPVDIDITGGRYVAPASVIMHRFAGAQAAYLSFTEAGLTAPCSADRWLPLAAGASLNIPSQGFFGASAKLSRTTGAISGDFTITDQNPIAPSAPRIIRSESYQGLIIPSAVGHVGRGYFLLPQLPAPVFPQPAVQPELSGAVRLE